MAPKCIAPLDSSDNPRLCGKPATTERLVEGLLCPLCAEHAAEYDADLAAEEADA